MTVIHKRLFDGVPHLMGDSGEICWCDPTIVPDNDKDTLKITTEMIIECSLSERPTLH